MLQDIINSLNEEQKKAVLATEGPVLINAGAGSGKTRVLTSRIAYLLEQNVPPQAILALTFTKKAANEMKDRISAMSDRNTEDLVMGTFHSVFIRFLRQYSESLGYPERFTIYDEEDSASCLKQCINETIFGIDWKEARKKADKNELKRIDNNYKVKSIQSRISIMKNNLITSDEYRNIGEFIQDDNHCARPRFADIFTLYERRCKEAGAMDFDDILINTHKLLHTNILAYRDLASRFEYILVDEYQDTNMVQYQILLKLAQRHHNICVVGDDSQSIYAFRGAKIDNILNFGRDYPDMKIFRLETNYRSTTQIVDAANRLIENNFGRLPKVCHAFAGYGDNVKIKRVDDDRDEARVVAGEIEAGVKEGDSWKDFAILYRTNAQSRAFEEFFLRNKIPYIIYSGLSFYERMEVKDVLAFLKLAVNPNDNEAFKRAVLKPSRGFGATSLGELQVLASRDRISLYEAATKLNLADEGFKPKAIASLKEFTDKLAAYNWDVVIEDAYDIAKRICDEMGIYEYYKSGSDDEDGKKRLENVDELLNNIAAFSEEQREKDPEGLPSLCDYLEDMALLSNVDTIKDKDTNKVNMMTVHASKGLEFKTVFVVGAEESLFPSYNESPTRQEIEEERRLFYVAMTRAKARLFISCAATRFRYGSRTTCRPSRFIDEVKGLKARQG